MGPHQSRRCDQLFKVYGSARRQFANIWLSTQAHSPPSPLSVDDYGGSRGTCRGAVRKQMIAFRKWCYKAKSARKLFYWNNNWKDHWSPSSWRLVVGTDIRSRRSTERRMWSDCAASSLWVAVVATNAENIHRYNIGQPHPFNSWLII